MCENKNDGGHRCDGKHYRKASAESARKKATRLVKSGLMEENPFEGLTDSEVEQQRSEWANVDEDMNPFMVRKAKPRNAVVDGDFEAAAQNVKYPRAQTEVIAIRERESRVEADVVRRDELTARLSSLTRTVNRGEQSTLPSVKAERDAVLAERNQLAEHVRQERLNLTATKNDFSKRFKSASSTAAAEPIEATGLQGSEIVAILTAPNTHPETLQNFVNLMPTQSWDDATATDSLTREKSAGDLVVLEAVARHPAASDDTLNDILTKSDTDNDVAFEPVAAAVARSLNGAGHDAYAVLNAKLAEVLKTVFSKPKA